MMENKGSSVGQTEKSSSMRSVLVRNFLLAVLVPLCIISILTLRFFYWGITEQVYEKNGVLTRSVADEINLFLYNTEAEMEHLVTYISAVGVDDKREIERYINILASQDTYFEMVQIVDMEGRVLYCTMSDPSHIGMSMARQEFFVKAKETGIPYWSKTFISNQTGYPTLAITFPLARNQGIAVGYLNLSRLNEICQRVGGIITGWIGIVDKEGTFIGHNHPEKVFQRESVRNLGYIQQALEGKKGNFSVEEKGQEILASTALVEITGWPVVVCQKKDTAMQAAIHAQRAMLAGSVLAVFFAGMLAYLSLRRILRPMDDLMYSMERVAGGRYNGAVQRSGYQEFNVMAEKFQDMQAAIEAREEELMAQQQELRRYMQSLESRNRELAQFAYVASHDLKAPLRAISNLSQWIEEDIPDMPSDSEVKKNLSLLRGRVQRMDSLISGILEYSRVGRVRRESQRVDSGELVREVIQSLGVPDRFVITVDKNMPVLVAEHIRLWQVFSNLISNAVKHHDQQRGSIQIKVEEEEQHYRFSVTDDGPGIDPAYHHKVFEIFQTLRAKDEVESTGIGLALVKKIVEEQGGEVYLESEKGSGATFFFTWPKPASDEDNSDPALNGETSLETEGRI